MAFLLKDYTEIQEVARGGMGKVYLATQISLNRKVIIKEMATGLLTNATEIKRFENEARAAAALEHDNIIRIYDFGEDRGSFYIAMEYIDGPDLDAILKEKHYLPEIGLMIVWYALKGLSHAHSHRIIHRDIKPGNILVSKAGAVKVVDFGLAHAGSQQLNLTASDVIVGTPIFMSPEQATGEEKKDLRMDVWSVGVLLYRIITGGYPFQGENVPAILYNIVQTREQRIHELFPALPRDLADHINACLVKDRSKRLSNLSPLITSLQNYFYEMGIKDTAEEIRRYVSDPQGSSRTLSRRLFEYHQRKAEAYLAEGNEPLSQAHAQHAKRYDPLYKPIVKAIDAIKKHTSSAIIAKSSRTGTVTSWQPPARKKSGAMMLVWAVIAVTLLGGGAGAFLIISKKIIVVRNKQVAAVAQQEVSAGPMATDTDSSKGTFDSNVLVAGAGFTAPQRDPPDTPVPGKRETTGKGGKRSVKTAKNAITKPESPDALAGSGQQPTGESNSSTSLVKARARQPLAGIMKIVITPPGAEVRINGEKISEQEMNEGRRCISGLHQIDATAQGYEPFSRAVTIEKGAMQIVTIDLVREKPGMSSLHIHSYPWAEIFIDGEFKGNTPTAKPLALIEGAHVIELRRTGYKTHQESISIKKGELQRIKVQLKSEQR
ncbi:MAG: serine/threonine protein kinase [Chitinispirillaceae bacterium]|nr:serine/threonine protein kinase [Chitinispirillaceae bacterium]